MLLADSKDYARAEAAFKHLLQIEPENGRGWVLLGMVEYELGRFDDALQHLQLGRTLGIGNAELEKVATFHAALILIWKGEFLVAQRLLMRVARAGAEDPDLIMALGLAALRISTWPDNLKAFEKPLVNRVGLIEYQAAHTPSLDSLAAYRDLVAEFPRVPSVHYAFGNFLLNAGQYQQGLEQMRQELEINPRDVLARLQLAMAYIEVNEPEKALPHAEEATHLDPKLFASHYALGWACYKLGRNDQAIVELERAVHLAPDSPQAHFALSQAYMRAGRKADVKRERGIFARLQQSEAARNRPTGAKEQPGSPAENPSSCPPL
jgi:tetratricopeptide (TPR) repeat protein